MTINLPSGFVKNGYLKASKVMNYILDNVKGVKTDVSDTNNVALKDITINGKSITGGKIDIYDNTLYLDLK